MIEHRAGAKINLSLLVGPVRADGYHELFTVFAPVDLYDELEFRLQATPHHRAASPLEVVCPGISGDDNIVAAALQAISAETDWEVGGRVVIRKGIAVAAGLGGGSADGALALRVGAQTVYAAGGPALSEDAVRRLARRLGADVSFFLDPRPAIGRGIGDLLEPLELPAVPGVLVTADDELSTALVYATFDRLATRESDVHFEERAARLERRWAALSQAWTAAGPEERASGLADMIVSMGVLLVNDLERASFSVLPRLAAVKDALISAGAVGALMSGSGPTMFGICPTPDDAAQAAARLAAEGLDARPVWLGGEAPGPP